MIPALALLAMLGLITQNGSASCFAFIGLAWMWIKVGKPARRVSTTCASLAMASIAWRVFLG